jgi:hypothetical protein
MVRSAMRRVPLGFRRPIKKPRSRQWAVAAITDQAESQGPKKLRCVWREFPGQGDGSLAVTGCKRPQIP